jgi:hypothetical protein
MLALVLAACAEAPRAADQPARAVEPPPPWAERLPSEPGMLFAVGSAARGDRESAAAAARRELASSIAVDVAAERRERAAASTTADSAGRRMETYVADVRAETSQRVAQEGLPGVTVRETRDAGDRTWALVAMDRAAWASALDARLAEIDRDLAAVDDGLRGSDEDREAVAAVRRWARQVPLFAARVEIAARLRLARPDAAVPPPAIAEAAARDQVAAALGRVLIAVSAHPPELSGAAAEACSALGLRADADWGALALAITAPDATTRRIDGEWRADGSASARLEVVADHRVLATVQFADRASALDEQTARFRLKQKLAADIAADLDRNLLSYLARWR